jgi:hypothetical protein
VVALRQGLKRELQCEFLVELSITDRVIVDLASRTFFANYAKFVVRGQEPYSIQYIVWLFIKVLYDMARACNAKN